MHVEWEVWVKLNISRKLYLFFAKNGSSEHPEADLCGMGGERPRNRAAPLHACCTTPAARGVVNVSERGRRWKEHDEAVKMVNFSRTKKPAKCDLDMNPRESLVPGSWSPGSRPGPVTVTFFASLFELIQLL